MSLNAPLVENSGDMENADINSRCVIPFQEKNDDYPENVVRTSRYTLISYLPKCLFEQFRRLANVYFVVLGIIAMIGTYTGSYASAVEPFSLLAPVIIVVMISVVKEGIEDWKRHQADAKVNARPTKVVQLSSGEVSTVEWKDLIVGSVVYLTGDEEIPADIVVLSSGGVQGDLCYVETAAIDGETNLKVKLSCLKKEVSKESTDSAYDRSISLSSDKSRVTGVDKLNVRITAEHPNSSIHHFDGSVEFTSDDLIRHKSTMTEKNLLLRGSVLRATEWCVGMVVYTGKQTKLSLNSRSPPSKLSMVDRVVNQALSVAIGAMIVVCVICMIFSISWQDSNNNANYLCINENDLSAQFGSGGCTSSATSSGLTFFTFATLFNNFVCISMYVSLEMIYLCQSYFIENDLNMYDEATDTPAECHTSGMCADIGQIQYILSDKTGTLTKNIMTLRRCSIAGLVYGAPLKPPDVDAVHDDVDKAELDKVVVEDLLEQGDATGGMSVNTDVALEETNTPIHNAKKNVQLSNLSQGDVPLTSSPSKSSENVDFYELKEMTAHRLSHPVNEAQILSEFLWNLTVCNTVMLMPDQKTGRVDITDIHTLKKRLQAESPDEVALVLAAAEYANELLVRRGPSGVAVQGVGRSDSWGASKDIFDFQVLAVNEFESDRKRMSILVRRQGSSPILYCKGADTSMLPYCVNNRQTAACKAHIEEFAVTGLRTLVMARRVLTESEAERWLATYKTASNNIGRRLEMLSECALAIEKDMELLGAVGIEDELQDDVNNTIQVLQRAGLNVWMITGDKPETAIAISQMCSLLRPEHRVHRIVGLKGVELREKIKDLKSLVVKETKRSSVQEQVVVETQKRNPIRQGLIKLFRRIRKFVLQLIAPPEPTQSTSRPELPTFRSTIAGVECGALALVIDGISLEEIWADENVKKEFTESIGSFPTVVACRVSPLQKATLVRMVKTGSGNPITLAIGDGANDVAMIHESRVGVGISGREGRHAANSSDFAIGQFRFLVPLLLHHGRFNYIRCSKLVLYSFFKNLVLVSMLFYYCFYSGFSGTITIDSFVLSGFNFYLGLPIIALGALDFDVSKEQVMLFPKLAYNTGRLGEMLNNWNMLRWCLSAFLFGIIIFAVNVRYFTGYLLVHPNDRDYGYISMSGIGYVNKDGVNGGIYAEGFLGFSALVIAMQLKCMLMTHTMTWINWASVILSVIGYFFFCFVYGLSADVADWYHIVSFTFPTMQFWLGLFLIPTMFVIADNTLEGVLSVLLPTSNDALRRKILSHSKAQEERK